MVVFEYCFLNSVQHPAHPPGELGSAWSHNYTYDALNRLTGASGSSNGASYTLEMVYGIMGNPLSKHQVVTNSPVAQSQFFTFLYTGSKPNAATMIRRCRYTKHYFAGTQRISSKIGTGVINWCRCARIINGKELDSETGLYYFGARYYDPAKAVWYGVNPLAELAPDWTPYRFGFNNPISFIDPKVLYETRVAAREHRREEGIGGRIRKQNDGTYAISP